MLSPEKKYEEYAYVLDFSPRGKSVVIKGREGPIVQAIGEERLTLRELLAVENQDFEPGERVRIGKEGREKIVSVLGKLSFEELTPESKSSLLSVVEKIVDGRERQPFKSFEEIQQRVGLREPAKLLARRIVEELSGGSRINLFIR